MNILVSNHLRVENITSGDEDGNKDSFELTFKVISSEL